MTLLAPALLGALVALPIIYLIHFLRGRRERATVPALFLWADLAPDPTGRGKRRLPPLSPLLLLQLLAAALMAVALARPATPADPRQHLVLVLDASASMQAVDVPDVATRFEAARARALDLLGPLAPRDIVSVVRDGAEVGLVADRVSPEWARQVVADVQPGAAENRLGDALALAALLAASEPEAPGRVVLISDGVAAVPPMPTGGYGVPVAVETVTGVGRNQALTSLQVRAERPGGPLRAFVEIANYDDRAVRVLLRLFVGDAEVDSRAVNLPPLERARLTVALPAGSAGRIAAQLGGRDALPLDDRVEVAVANTAARSQVLLVSADGTEGPVHRALGAMPTTDVLAVTLPPDTNVVYPPADVTVFDGLLPDALPPGPLLLVRPPASARLFAPSAPAQQVDTARDYHPLLDGVDQDALRSAPSLLPSGTPGWARLVLGTVQQPLVMDGWLDGRPVAVLAFDPTRSGMERSLAFPLLVSNALVYLQQQVQDPQLQPGQVPTLPIAPLPPGASVALLLPEGARRAVQVSPLGDVVLPPAATDAVGRYQVVNAADDRLLRQFSVQLGDSAESDTRPRPDFAAAVQSPGPLLAAAETPPVDEWWRVLAGAALAVLASEWLVFARRP